MFQVFAAAGAGDELFRRFFPGVVFFNMREAFGAGGGAASGFEGFLGGGLQIFVRCAEQVVRYQVFGARDRISCNGQAAGHGLDQDHAERIRF